MKSNPFVRRVNRKRPALTSISLPVAAHPSHTDPDELPPTCSGCGGPCHWYLDQKTGTAELLCASCVPPSGVRVVA